jgi:hypothetical protein
MRDSRGPFGDSTIALSAREALSGFPDPDQDLTHPFRQRPARHFIVTHGRSGSSLLAAILEDCGADFGKASRGGDTFKEHWENRTLERAIRCAHNANRLFEPGMDGGRRMAYRFWRSRAKHLLRSGLKATPYSKNRWNTTILPLAEQLGWRPVLVISYRAPGEVAMSDMLQLKNAASTFLPMIMKVYVDSLYSLQRYGGVVVDHSELIDVRSEAWAHGLAAVTGFAPSALLDSRNRLLRPGPPRPAPNVWVPPELESIAAMLGERRNRPLGPSV